MLPILFYNQVKQQVWSLIWQISILISCKTIEHIAKNISAYPEMKKHLVFKEITDRRPLHRTQENLQEG